MVSYIVVQLSTGKWSVYSSLTKEMVGFYTRKDSAIRKVKTLIKKDGGLHTFEVIQDDVSRFYRNDEQFNYIEFDYFATSQESQQVELSDSTAIQSSNETPLNYCCRVLGESLFSINKAKEVLSYINGVKDIYLSADMDNAGWALEGVAQAHAQTQRVERGAERGVARSPP